ncbi:hypothetical protein [Demequina sp.]|uniref:hypothetical protein n=1 Tax=Demequina sp. TaxID=2050685 RepID=UPI0025C65726|nr:hypothetical protein [Demequina sp.]
MKDADAKADTIGTGDLAAWFGMSRAGVIKALRRSGVRPASEARPRVETRWPRLIALNVLNRRVGPRV